LGGSSTLLQAGCVVRGVTRTALPASGPRVLSEPNLVV
jgi:hypothetical protein